MNNQSKLESLIEISINITSGFILSLLIWIYIITPFYNIKVTMQENLSITLIFTIVAVIRGYFWRRFFNNQLHKIIIKWVK